MAITTRPPGALTELRRRTDRAMSVATTAANRGAGR